MHTKISDLYHKQNLLINMSLSTTKNQKIYEIMIKKYAELYIDVCPRQIILSYLKDGDHEYTGMDTKDLFKYKGYFDAAIVVGDIERKFKETFGEEYDKTKHILITVPNERNAIDTAIAGGNITLAVLEVILTK